MFLEVQGKLIDPQSRELDLKELTKNIPSNTYFGEWEKRDDGKSECSFRCMSMFFPWYNNIFADLTLDNLNGEILEPFNKITITEDMIDKESFGILTLMAKQDDDSCYDDSCDNSCDSPCSSDCDTPCDTNDDKPDFTKLLAELKYEGGSMADYVQKYAAEFELMAESLAAD